MATISAWESKENSAGDNELYEDMFIILDDPTGCAYDICEELAGAFHELNRLVADVNVGPDGDREHMLLQAHTVFLYQMLYGAGSDNDQISGLRGKVIDEKYFEFLLGKELRTTTWNEINKLRDSLLFFLQTEYYLKSLVDIENLNVCNTLLGERIILDHFELLKADPSFMDRHLETAQPDMTTHKRVLEYLESVYDDDSHPFVKIVTKTVDLEDLVTVDERYRRKVQMSELIWANIMSIASLTNIRNDEKSINLKRKWLNDKVHIRSKNIGGAGKKEFIVLESANLDDVLKSMGLRTKDGTFTAPGRGGFGRGTKGLSGILAPSGTTEVPKVLKLNADIDPSLSQIHNPKIEKVMFSKLGAGFGGVLSAASLYYAVADYENNKGRNRVNIAAAASELVFYGGKYAELHFFKRQNLIGISGKVGRVAGYLATIVSSVACFYDAAVALRERDYDFAAAQAMAGICFGAAFYFSIWGVGAATAKAAGTVVAGATIAGVSAALAIFFLVLAVVLVIFAFVYLKDTPVEAYFKNFILRKDALKKTNLSRFVLPSELVRDIISRKDVIINTAFREFRDLKYSYEELMVVCPAIRTECDYYVHRQDPPQGLAARLFQSAVPPLVHRTLDEVTVVSCFPNMSFDSHYEVEAHIYYLEQYGEPMRHEELDLQTMKNRGHLSLGEDENGCVVLKLESLKSYLKKDMEQMFQSRLYICQRMVSADGLSYPFDGKYYDNSFMIPKLDGELAVRITQGLIDYESYSNRENAAALLPDDLHLKLITK